MWIVPKPISACMPEAVDSTWDSSVLTETLSASLSWNTKHQRSASWSTTLKRVYWMPLLCSRMPTPSRQNDFTDWWTGSLADRRVSRSASQGNNSAQMTRETSGLSLSEWWDRFSQEAASLRTSHQPNLFGTSTRKSSPDFNIWATKLRAAYSQRLRLARHTTESESSSWPTPDTTGAGTVEAFTKDGQPMNPGERAYDKNGVLVQRTLNRIAENWPAPRSAIVKKGDNIEEAAAMWPTPEASNGTVGEIPKKNVYILPSGRPRAVTNSGQTGSIGLAREAQLWATPTARDGKGHTTTENHPDGFKKSLGDDVQNWITPTTQDAGKATQRTRADHQNNLTAQMAQWPTPTALDYKHEYSPEALTRKDGKSRMDSLPSMATYGTWQTPSANEDAAGTVKGKMQHMLSHQAQEATGVTSQNDSGQRLNPAFVTWLMGWPDGWVRFHALKNSASSETE